MAHISREVTIDAPVEEVFDLVADERNEPRYNPRIVHAEKLSEGPGGGNAAAMGVGHGSSRTDEADVAGALPHRPAMGAPHLGGPQAVHRVRTAVSGGVPF
jgi:hypothetical protein